LNISSPNVTSATTTTTTAAPTAARKKRDILALSCREISPILDTLSHLVHDGYTMGIYQTSTIVRNCKYIDDSSVRPSDCSPYDLGNLMQSYKVLKANITTANADYLPLLDAEAVEVERERSLWLDQWQNTSAIQMNLDLAKFQQLVANETILKNEAQLLYIIFIL
jgi:hypothetical protein